MKLTLGLVKCPDTLRYVPAGSPLGALALGGAPTLAANTKSLLGEGPIQQDKTHQMRVGA
jgi:hypothetical protein